MVVDEMCCYQAVLLFNKSLAVKSDLFQEVLSIKFDMQYFRFACYFRVLFNSFHVF